MGTMTFKDRIKRRLNALDLSVAEAERCAELPRTYLADLLSGKKKTLKDDALARLATVLKTTDIWLLREAGAETLDQPEGRAPAFQGIPPTSSYPFDTSEISDVGNGENADIVIVRLDISSGECLFHDKAGSAAVRIGIVVDPALFLANNAYASHMAARRALRVLLKRVTLASGAEISFILDNATA
jgi:transcriptional regulator with XRE-family HTH domain